MTKHDMPSRKRPEAATAHCHSGNFLAMRTVKTTPIGIVIMETRRVNFSDLVLERCERIRRVCNYYLLLNKPKVKTIPRQTYIALNVILGLGDLLCCCPMYLGLRGRLLEIVITVIKLVEGDPK